MNAAVGKTTLVKQIVLVIGPLGVSVVNVKVAAPAAPHVTLALLKTLLLMTPPLIDQVVNGVVAKLPVNE